MVGLPHIRGFSSLSSSVKCSFRANSIRYWVLPVRMLACSGKVIASGYLAGLNPELNLEFEFWKQQICAWLAHREKVRRFARI